MWESSCNVSEHFNVINKVFGNHGFIFPRIMDAHFELCSFLCFRCFLIVWFCLLSRSDLDSPKYLYIEMELCSAKTLRTWIIKMNANQKQERKEQSLSIFRQIVNGVEYIHSTDLIHRDLKVRSTPSNPG